MTAPRRPPTASIPTAARCLAHDLATAVRLGDAAAIAECQRRLAEIEERSCHHKGRRRARRPVPHSCATLRLPVNAR